MVIFHSYVSLPEGNSHVMGCHVDHISGRPSTVFPGALLTNILRMARGWPHTPQKKSRSI